MDYSNLIKELELLSSEYEEGYQQMLVDFKVNASYKLYDSVEGKVTIMGNEYRVILRLEDYWKAVEEGSKSGTVVELNKIIRWIQDKGIKPNPKTLSVKSLGTLIVNKIYNKGIKPRPILAKLQGIKQTDAQARILEAFRKDLNNETKLISLVWK